MKNLNDIFDIFIDMVERHDESFLTTGTWENVQKKIRKSKKIWNEI